MATELLWSTWTSPDRWNPCRAFPPSVRMKRCFIRSVMLLQPAVTADTGRYHSVWDLTILVTSCMIILDLLSSRNNETQFRRKLEDYSEGDCRTPLSWQGREQKCAVNVCVSPLSPRLSFHSFCRQNLFAVGIDACCFYLTVFPSATSFLGAEFPTSCCQIMHDGLRCASPQLSGKPLALEGIKSFGKVVRHACHTPAARWLPSISPVVTDNEAWVKYPVTWSVRLDRSTCLLLVL